MNMTLFSSLIPEEILRTQHLSSETTPKHVDIDLTRTLKPS